ncbi:SDR family oxidoreductase [Actinomycetospora chlora]|uniref:SDR family oxidoreductase n=1 Tax=Actinomycetospora chlora TaxID=663608 RepID=A0ABP9C6U4_9PSEU
MGTELSGSTALVTGATSGIGRATAVRLAALGAHVVVSGRDQERGDAVVAAIRADGGRADVVAADLRDDASVAHLADRATELGGGHVDVLVNSAGVFPFGATTDFTAKDLDETFVVNVTAPYLLVAALAPAMAERGHGAIVNVTTMVAEFGMSGAGLYGASKAALVLLTKSWAAEFGPSGVRVNAVSPGPTRTEGTLGMGDGLDALAAGGPAGRPAQPDEIAAAIAFLATDDASFVHGAVLPADGGRIAV